MGKYILMNDIDLSSYSNWNPIGEVDSNGIKQGFTGVLDGNGYTISNLTINRPGEVGVGLFCMIGDFSGAVDGEVKNLGLENVNITSDGSSGGLAGGAHGDISNCYVTGKIASTVGQTTGGLVAAAMSCNISNSYTDCDVSGYAYVGGMVGMGQGVSISGCYSLGDTEADFYVGGLVGYAMSLTITNSYSSGDVTEFGVSGVSSCAAGGLVGSGEVNISNSYSTSKVVSNANNFGSVSATGGLCGIFAGSISNSIWDIQKTAQSTAIGDNQGGTESNNKGLTTAEMQDPSNWTGWDTSIWDFSTYPPTFKMYTPTGGGSTGGGTGGTDPSGPNNPDTPGGGDVPIPGAVRLQIGSDSSSTSAIYVDTSFDLGAFDVDFSSADSCAAAIEDIDEVLSRINTKRSEFGAVINRLSSVLESQTTTIQNFTSAKSTIMDADIANESADFVKNQILQQTSSALLAQSQNLHASIVLSLIG